MSDVVIKVENLSKQYRLGQVGTGTLKDDFKRWRYRLMGKEDPFLTVGEVNDRTIKTSADYVWALKDINFEVKRGEVLGIIGKNGAGKSTLLKILSRTTGPTTGSLKMRGRIASLLEVGTGFHGELSGRENIFLNGAILGMRKSEISKKFDEIVDFAGVEKYIDTPVKRYSSGMYVRLAFGVAAHLEPDILIVDEVLAVGDAEFQKKAIGKMQDVSKGEGRTVLFVSHNMASMLNLCNKGLILNNGSVAHEATIESAVNFYLKNSNTFNPTESLVNRIDRKGNQKVKFTKVEFLDESFSPVTTLLNGHKVIIALSFDRLERMSILKDVHFSIGVNDNSDTRVLLLSTDLTQQTFQNIPPEVNKVFIEIPKLQLKAGHYSYTLHLKVKNDVSDWVFNAGTFNVVSGDFFNTGATLPDNQGFFLADHSFYLDQQIMNSRSGKRDVHYTISNERIH